MPEEAAILKESGFYQGMAQQMRDDVPDPDGAGRDGNQDDLRPSGAQSPEKPVSSSRHASPEDIGSARVRSASPAHGTAVQNNTVENGVRGTGVSPPPVSPPV